MLAAHLAAGTRDTFAINRALLSRPVVQPFATAVPLNRTQFVQATWALKDVTCADVAAKDAKFNDTLAKAMIEDTKAALIAKGWSAAVPFVKAVRQPCKDIEVGTRGC
jgi:hypothetical protein